MFTPIPPMPAMRSTIWPIGRHSLLAVLLVWSSAVSTAAASDGNYFRLGSDGHYRIELTITPQDAHPPVTMEFTHEHRIQ